MISVSVVIPCYNSSETILKCLDSIVSQTMRPNEIIVVDDGSTDGTVGIIRKYSNEYDIPIILIEQENGGPSVARNKGVLNAKSNWIAFLDSDDYWENNKLLNQVEIISLDRDVVLIGSSGTLKEKMQVIRFNDLLKRNYFQTSAVLVKKEIMLEFPFNEKQKYSEDYLSWLMICFKYKTIVSSPSLAFPINKNLPYSGNGLSSRLFLMEKWELRNYFLFYKEKKISFVKLLGVSLYSFSKFIRRVLIKNIYEK
ncbi:glycosyltransferase family 2 protein [Myroides odoratimimus]|uniref:glycosyltransferase family 2 protein n=1 Tax=Myroides odoratimimus TaxID=76832 RepID=UPI0025778A35|nr:glycosyltransferase family 2 protein [Myroides odoratimimus]MDM1514305.1 glycosyltransferase family 2 protein [Myroides odoratimimus]MEC4043996.1 glycosyltransferase family 2 protein [Myroides odoratimimus]MEC4151826.1 glycosyltransferase family 2 protein [Myroides odoratimimus]